MKTIEQAAREMSFDIYKTSLTDGQQLHVGDESKTEESILQAIEKGIKAGAEFVQRWIPVDSGELPEKENGFYKPVLVLNDNYGLCSSAAYKNGIFIPDNTVLESIEITHWRPIELK